MNYIDCKICSGWSNEVRVDKLCKKCNNSRLIKDPKEMLCNLCGDTMQNEYDEYSQYGLIDAEVSGGYFSHYLLDMSNYIFSFCEKCLRKLFKECKVPPIVENYNFGSEDTEECSFEKDDRIFDYSDWCKNGGDHQAYINGKCNTIKNCSNDATCTILSSDEFSEKCCCEEHKELMIYTNQKLVPFISDKLKSFI